MMTSSLKYRLSAITCTLWLVMFSCDLCAEVERFHFTEAHLGTKAQLIFYADTHQNAEQIAGNAFQRIQDLELVFSDYKPESELNSLCKDKSQTTAPVSKELFEVLQYALDVSNKSYGLFDVTIGKHTQRWRKLKNHDDSLSNVKPLHGYYKQVFLHPQNMSVECYANQVQFDLGGIAKGYIADQVLNELESQGVTQAIVAIGGDIVAGAPPPGKTGWKVGIEAPDKIVVDTVELAHQAMSTSGGSYQFRLKDGIAYAHILDPRTGRGLVEPGNVTVIAKQGVVADAWATALSIPKLEDSIKLVNQQQDIAALYSSSTRPVIRSDGFPQ